MKEYSKQYYRTNKEQINACHKRYYQIHREETLKRNKQYNFLHREDRRKYGREYYRTHSEEYKEYRKIHKQKENEKQREKWKNNPMYHLNSVISEDIRRALKGKKAGRKWEILVGYTIEDLIKYLESKFEPWMNWDNYGKWDVDHIKPKSLFKYKTAEDPEFKQCWALENLQPLEHMANLKKSNYY